MAEQTVNQYEAMFLLGPAGTMEPEAALNLVRQSVERHGGQIIVLKRWDERRLAYEIEGQKRGTYIICFFRAQGGAVSGIERDVRLSEQILRVIVLRADHLNEQEMAAAEPQPIMRDERDRGWDAEGRPPREGGYRDREGGYGYRDRAPRGRREEAPAGAPAAAPAEGEAKE